MSKHKSENRDNQERAAKGGRARAEALSPEDRQEIARVAAQARWGPIPKYPRETHTGILSISEREIPCSVLDNGLRVFSARGLSRAIGSRTKSIKIRPGQEHVYAGARQMPPFLASPSIRPFIPNDLMAPVISPIQFKTKSGGGNAYGYEASLLPRICGVILDANKAGVFRPSQRHLVETVELLIRGLAHVGVIALVDEATGYQSERARDELSKILEAYISKELLPWTKRFPDEFFRQIYRLHGWEFKPGTLKGPRYVGKLVNRLVYEPLPPGVLDQLKQMNPPNEKGYRKHRHHQFLTEEIGNLHLERQIIEVTTLMRVADDKRMFQSLFQKAFPKTGEQLSLPMPANEETRGD